MPQELIPIDQPPVDNDGLTELRADTIGYLAEHYPKEILKRKMDLIADDLEGRGHDGKPRRLTIELVFREKQGRLDVHVEVKEKLPTVVTPGTQLKRNRAGRLAFRADSPHNPDQPTLPMPRVASAE